MSTSTEFEIKVSGGKIELPEDLPDGIYRRVIEVETPTKSNQEKVFVRIPVSELSINDPWFKYHMSETLRERDYEKFIKNAIEKGLKDFWRPKYDPSFSNEKHTKICYLPGKRPAVGKTYRWWKKKAKRFLPKCKSRLGTDDEYFLFLAVLIKKLTEGGWSIAQAWDAVCNDSKQLGHYTNSPNSKNVLEDTGCREVCGFYDLANTSKFLAEEKETGCFGIVNYSSKRMYGILANLCHLAPWCGKDTNIYKMTTGWIVLEKDPYTTK